MEKRRNPFRYEPDVLLTGIREWDKRLKVPENYLEWMQEAYEPVDSPAYQWFVRFKYMPIFAQLEEKDVCWYDHEFAFGKKRCASCSTRRSQEGWGPRRGTSTGGSGLARARPHVKDRI